MELLFSLSDDNENKNIMIFNHELYVDSYLSPIALMFAYFVSTLSLINRSQYEHTFNTIRMNLGPKTNEISSHAFHMKNKNEIVMKAEPSMLEQFFYMVFDITSFIYKNSYILLNIIMMVNIFPIYISQNCKLTRLPYFFFFNLRFIKNISNIVFKKIC